MLVNKTHILICLQKNKQNTNFRTGKYDKYKNFVIRFSNAFPFDNVVSALSVRVGGGRLKRRKLIDDKKLISCKPTCVGCQATVESS